MNSQDSSEAFRPSVLDTYDQAGQSHRSASLSAEKHRSEVGRHLLGFIIKASSTTHASPDRGRGSSLRPKFNLHPSRDRSCSEDSTSYPLPTSPVEVTELLPLPRSPSPTLSLVDDIHSVETEQPQSEDSDNDNMGSARLQTFSGSRSRPEDPDDFVCDIEQVVTAITRRYPMSEEEINKELVSTFRRHIEGPASDWYYGLPRGPNRQTWTILKPAFLCAFQVDEGYERLTRQTKEREFGNLRQGDTENIHDYLARAEALFRGLTYQSPDAGWKLVGGLRDADIVRLVRFQMRVDGTESFYDVRRLIRMGAFAAQ